MVRRRMVGGGLAAGLASLVVFVSLPSAHAGDDDVTRIAIVKSVTATSTLAGKDDRYGAAHILDMQNVEYADDPPSTGWCEGKRDEGVGESVTIAFHDPVKVSELSIKAGFWKTEALFRKNNIVTGLEVSTDDGRKQTVSLPAAQEDVTVDIGGAPVKQVTLKITKVKKGKMNDSCISSVIVRTDPPAAVVLGMDPALAAGIARAERALASCDEKRLAGAVAFPFTWAPLTYGEEGESTDVRHTYKNAAEMSKACKEGSDLTPSGRVPGLDFVKKKDGTMLLTDGGCGADCMDWRFVSKKGSWLLSWVGPAWIDPPSTP